MFLLLLDPLLPGFTVPLTEKQKKENLNAIEQEFTEPHNSERDTIMSCNNVF